MSHLYINLYASSYIPACKDRRWEIFMPSANKFFLAACSLMTSLPPVTGCISKINCYSNTISAQLLKINDYFNR